MALLVIARLVSALIVACSVIVLPQDAAAANEAESATVRAADFCSVEEWRIDPRGCLDRLGDVARERLTCLRAPTPETPDSGLGGWFAEREEVADQSGVGGYYSDMGYAGYSFTTYDIGCAQTLLHPDYKFENTVANFEFMVATAIVGAANSMRDRAWDPGSMWGWADRLVDEATRAIYARVFTVFGAVTLAVVGVYLLWRSRQARMSAALTTAGWAGLVMVVVTALASWPVQSARLADQALVTSLATIHDAVGPPPLVTPVEECPFDDYQACVDRRPPQLRASDNAVYTLLYRNWLRGLLGSADSETAEKYGWLLYNARTVSWFELDSYRDPELRPHLIERKARDWMRVAEQIRSEDPDAYQYLQGTKGMERIGAGLVAVVAAVVFATFDIMASLLVLLGFLVFRWAVIAAPLIGTVALLRPASAGFRRLMHSVVAALFNVVVLGTGAAIYLRAVDLVMNTSSLPGWLQIVLVLLCGMVGWMLLRPYRRITQLGGKDPIAAIAAGGLHLRRRAAPAPLAEPARVPPLPADRPPERVELRSAPETATDHPPSRPGPTATPSRAAPVPERVAEGWDEPAEAEHTFTLYRPIPPQPSTVDAAVRPARLEARPEP